MRRRAVALAAVTGLLVAGCGQLPLAGGVRVERTISETAADTGAGSVRVLPPPPAADASPTDIVRGFLNAQADGESDYAIARQYLGPDANWQTAGAVSIYASADYPAGPPPPTAAAAGIDPAARTTTVAVVLDRTAVLDPTGVYTPRSDQVAETFRLARIGGQWRILTPPPGLQLTAGDLQRTYVPSTLWWFTTDLRTLVPEQRWLPSVAAGRPTQLVRALLTGPSPALAGVVRSAAPNGLALDGSVSVVGNDIVVDFSPAAAALTPGSARLLLVQLAATLRQAASGTAVRLLVDGQPLPNSLAPQRLPISAVAGYDPDLPPPAAPSIALVGGRLSPVAGSAPLPAAAAGALAGRDLLVAVPAPTGGAIAAVERSAGGDRLVIADAGGTLRSVGPTVPAGGYGTPSWSEQGTLAVPGPRGLLVAAPGRPPVVVPAPAGIGPITSARLARDGVRLVVVAGTTAYLTTLTGGSGALVLGPLVPVSTGLGPVTAAAWESASLLALVVRAAAGTLSLAQVAPDGSQPEMLALPADVGLGGVRLAGASGVPLLVGGAGTIAELTGDASWRTVARGTAPAAPG